MYTQQLLDLVEDGMIRPIVFTAKGMAKHPPLSVGMEKTKHFDFTLDDNDFEGHTRRFIPATTAAEGTKLYSPA